MWVVESKENCRTKMLKKRLPNILHRSTTDVPVTGNNSSEPTIHNDMCNGRDVCFNEPTAVTAQLQHRSSEQCAFLTTVKYVPEYSVFSRATARFKFFFSPPPCFRINRLCVFFFLSPRIVLDA